MSEHPEGYDPEAVRAKYLAERDKRLVPGRAAIRDLGTDAHFAHYRDDPFTAVSAPPPAADLVADALFHTGVDRAEWDEGAARWRIRTDRGDDLGCRWYVLAVGILNLLKLPAIPGMEDFAGRSFHSARWDYGYTGGGPHEPL